MKPQEEMFIQVVQYHPWLPARPCTAVITANASFLQGFVPANGKKKKKAGEGAKEALVLSRSTWHASAFLSGLEPSILVRVNGAAWHGHGVLV